jgi:hypothetical protein
MHNLTATNCHGKLSDHPTIERPLLGGKIMEEKILTLHPEGKQGTNISKVKYDTVRQAILDVVMSNKSITFTKMTTQVEEKLAGKFDGSIPWYVTTVKLDLEARGEIERVPGSSPQQLRPG